MATHECDYSVKYDGIFYEWSADQTAGETIEISESISNPVTDMEVSCSADVSAMKGFMIMSTQALTVETNSGSSPTNTLTLVANKPIIWTYGSGLANPLTGDITTNIFVTNASGAEATLTIKILQDPTP